MTRLVNEHDEVTTFSYDDAGREVLKELDNGTRASIVYDAAGQQLTVANLQENGDVISRFAYTYDAAGNRTQELREDDTLRVWTYDPTGQLISERRLSVTDVNWDAMSLDQWSELTVDDWNTLPAGAISPNTTTFTYDAVGNRLVKNAAGELTTSTYDAGNQLRNSEDSQGISTYTYDADGNQRSVETPAGDITTYSWSYENQLSQVEQPDDVVITYQYAPVTRDADELQVSKETDLGMVQLIWDNQNVIRELDDTGLVEAEYTLNPQPYGDLVSQHREDESSFYNYDALGSTESLTDESATKTDEYAYDAFGALQSQTGTTENAYLFVGELGYRKDQDTGLIEMRRRQYSTQLDRFLSKDPFGFEGGDENLYRYVKNNPVNQVDPSGEATV